MELEVNNLRKLYPGTVRALNGVSLRASAGETIALMGPSGSGKSTLLSLLAGIESPSSGEIRVDGRPLSSYAPLERFRAERTGLVFQFHHLLPHLTLRENVETPLVPLKVSAGQRRTRALEILDRLGLSERAGFYPTRVSGGERQRCALARALVNRPELLLADEPTGNLDTETGTLVVSLLVEWAQGHQATLIVATHDPQMARLVQRRILIRDGVLESTGECPAGEGGETLEGVGR